MDEPKPTTRDEVVAAIARAQRDGGAEASNAIVALTTFYAGQLVEERAKVAGLRSALAIEELARDALEEKLEEAQKYSELLQNARAAEIVVMDREIANAKAETETVRAEAAKMSRDS